jgi:2-haloacid dehalogenase
MVDEKIKALTFDTGGTILDWHSGFYSIFSKIGNKYGIEKDWHLIVNELRRRSLEKMINLGEKEPPKYNFDDVNRIVLNELCVEYGLDMFTEEDRYEIAWTTPHNFKVWGDFIGMMPKLRAKFLCCSFTILSFRIIIDTAKKNGLVWDSVFSCEAIGKYKTLSTPYKTVAKWLQLDPSEICMVACHNFDLNAAKNAGFKTAFVKRPDEWGPAGPPDPEPNPQHDIIVDTFPDLAKQLNV